MERAALILTLVFVATMFLPAPMITRFVIVRRPLWSANVVSLASAAILPLILIILAFVFDLHTDFKIIDQCVDQGCVMAIELAQILREIAGLIFFVGLTLSLLVVLLKQRSERGRTSADAP